MVGKCLGEKKMVVVIRDQLTSDMHRACQQLFF